VLASVTTKHAIFPAIFRNRISTEEAGPFI
jgi:hypothetical protein